MPGVLTHYICTLALRALTHKSVHFKWEPHHQREFQSLRKALLGSISLSYFNPKLTTHIIVDAHIDGLCAIMAQGETPITGQAVAIASRATSNTEKRYPQLDLEAMAVDFGLRRFRQNLIGNPSVKIHSDHKPLIAIFQNSRKGSIRIERIKLRHQDIAYTIVHLKGSNNPADFCSRNLVPWCKLPPNIRNEADETERLLYYLQEGGITTSIGQAVIAKASQSCPEISALSEFIRGGKTGKIPDLVLPYRHVIRELSVAPKGTAFRDTRVIVPLNLRNKALEVGHGAAHLGISAMMRRMRSMVWFPGMDKRIENFVKSCKKCQLFVPAAPGRTLLRREPPPLPWHSISADYFGPIPDGRHVLVTRCDLTRFVAAVFVRATSAENPIVGLRSIFAKHGTPRNLRTDNATAFSSQSFKSFMQESGIAHSLSPRHHPQSNPAECAMKLVGKAIKLSDQTPRGMEHALATAALADYRDTPHIATGVAPSMAMKYKKKDPSLAKIRLKERAHRYKCTISIGKGRRSHQCKEGDLTWVLDMTRRNKFKPFYLPHHFQVCERLHGHTLSTQLQCPETGQMMVRHAIVTTRHEAATLKSQGVESDPPIIIVSTGTTTHTEPTRLSSLTERERPPIDESENNSLEETLKTAQTRSEDQQPTKTPNEVQASGETLRGGRGEQEEDDVFAGPLRRNWRPEESEPALKKIRDSMTQYKPPRFKAHPPHPPVTRSLRRTSSSDSATSERETLSKKTQTNWKRKKIDDY